MATTTISDLAKVRYHHAGPCVLRTWAAAATQRTPAQGAQPHHARDTRLKLTLRAKRLGHRPHDRELGNHRFLRRPRDAPAAQVFWSLLVEHRKALTGGTSGRPGRNHPEKRSRCWAGAEKKRQWSVRHLMALPGRPQNDMKPPT
jgi:hypothetical protein